MKWVTRERPKIDRIACPWLITRFIERDPEFLYVAPERVLAVAKETEAIPYDIPGVELSHVGDLCSFDAFISKYALHDPALQHDEMLRHGIVMYDALYAWCARLQGESHNWPPKGYLGAA